MHKFLPALALSISVLIPATCLAQQAKPTQAPAPFKWVNPLPGNVLKSVQHGTFFSAANKTEVGYCVLLPPGYERANNQKIRYPVVYWLHGGRPGGETKAIAMAKSIAPLVAANPSTPIIYVFPNGGKLSHYDHGDSQGEQAFLELIKHVDATYRTIADRSGRGVEGFSQGGRGAGRYMFKFPELFCSAAPLGGGQQHEKRISESDGVESESLTISPPWNNTWDLAKRYAARKDAPQLRIFIAVGDDDFNYEGNKEWTQHLQKLGIEHEFMIVPGIPHSSQKMYEKIGDKIVQFHIESFRKSGALAAE